MYILNECNKRNFNFIPDIVYADFEVAIHTALFLLFSLFSGAKFPSKLSDSKYRHYDFLDDTQL